MVETMKVDNTWEQYNLSEHVLGHNGRNTGYKAIIKDGSVVYIASDGYQLLPNEEAVKVADDTASLMGAVPFDKFTGKWFVKANGHVFYTGEQKAQVHALYTMNGAVDIGGGDMINLGFAIHNSIDGSMGFSVGAFTFRHACANMVFMGFKGANMQFDDRNTLAYAYQKHTKSLEIDKTKLQRVIIQVVDSAKSMLEQYRRWKEEELLINTAKKLAKRLPEKYLPDYIKVDEKKVELLATTTIWNAYNDITQAIWHNDKTDYALKKGMFDKLHRALIEVRQDGD